MKHTTYFALLSAFLLLAFSFGCTQAKTITNTPGPSTGSSGMNTVEVPPATSPDALPPTPPEPQATPQPNPTPAPAPATVNIAIQNFAFAPASITVKKGTTVIWTNMDTAPHKVASNPHPTHTDLPGLVSGTLNKGDTFSYTFNKVGTWGYHCHLHPSMTGTVIVQE